MAVVHPSLQTPVAGGIEGHPHLDAGRHHRGHQRAAVATQVLLEPTLHVAVECEGTQRTVVNDQVLLEDGKHCGALPGNVPRNSSSRAHLVH
jgi:hypothetical protein